MENQDQIVDEIRQLITQYEQEVPSNRRAWPEAIKSRVRALRAHGLELKEIEQRTGISYYTVYRWLGGPCKPPAAGFQAVAIVPTPTAPEPKKRDTSTVTVKTPEKERKARRKSATVTVTMPGGLKIERATVEFLADLMQRLGRK